VQGPEHGSPQKARGLPGQPGPGANLSFARQVRTGTLSAMV